MTNLIQKKNYLRTNSIFVKYLSIIMTIFVSFSLIYQQSYAQEDKLNISIKKNDVSTKTAVYRFLFCYSKIGEEK